VLFLGVTGFCLSCSWGLYQPVPVVLFAIAFVFFCVCVFRPRAEEEWQTRALECVAIFFATLLALRPLLLYPEDGLPYQFMRGCLGVAAFAILVRFFLRTGLDKLVALWAAVLALFAARFLSLRASPDPFIDVFILLRNGCRFLLERINPYTQSYPDIYLERYGSSGYSPALNYPPGILYWLLPFEWLTKDVRTGYVVADAITAGVLFLGARKLGRSTAFSQNLALAWVAYPTCLFTIEQAWVDSVLILAVSLLLLSLLHERWIWAGVCAGFVVGSKQYAVLIVLFIGIWLFRQSNFDRRNARRFFAAALATAAALYLPFFLADPGVFYYDLVPSLLSQPVRFDAFTLVALSYWTFGFTLPMAIVLVIYGVTLAMLVVVLVTRKTADLRFCMGCSVILYGVVFLFGKQAFCNYYQFLAIQVCWYLACRNLQNRQKGAPTVLS
jgi:hypothetical protein